MESVRVTVGFTQNVGNFENIKTEIAWEVRVEDDETHVEATSRAFEKLEPVFVEKAGEVYDSMSDDARAKTKINPRR